MGYRHRRIKGLQIDTVKTIFFIIKGNHNDPEGNAFPKLKMTGKQHWTDKAQDYVKWKAFVQKQLMNELRIVDGDAWRQCEKNFITTKSHKPIVIEKNQTARMDILISWKGNTHGDPENIFGSIADALFHNDKNLFGSFLPLEGKTTGEVWCTITISD